MCKKLSSKQQDAIWGKYMKHIMLCLLLCLQHNSICVPFWCLQFESSHNKNDNIKNSEREVVFKLLTRSVCICVQKHPPVSH